MSLLKDHTTTLSLSLTNASLVPGPASPLISSSFAPTTVLNVAFGAEAVELGTFLRAGECNLAPSISFAPEAGAPSNVSYTLILTDPDAPTPDKPQFAFWRHWVLPGLQPLSGNGAGEVAMTKPALTQYLGPGPKDDSKPHRYLFLLYREPEALHLTKEDVGGEEFVQRRSFKPAEWAEKHGLNLVGFNWMTCAGDGWTE
ncbi:phosphatidylethanolamine-binding protein [Xylariales sp. AK1849]|nr:phosphatidylethanolamine-binding protein [Xylariales sp. AK1849]